MKMKNPKMEFVTFDTQDVIATSGPLTGVNMMAKISAIYEYNSSIPVVIESDGVTTYTNGAILNPQGQLNGLYKGSGRTDEWWNEQQNKYMGYKADGDLLADAGSNGDKSGYSYVADTVKQIMAWLRDNGYQ